MKKLFSLSVAFAFSLIVLIWATPLFSEEIGFWDEDIWAAFLILLPLILLSSGGVVTLGIALIKNIIRQIKDAAK